MGDKILIYDSGQKYEIDDELIYIPAWARPSVKKKIDAILPDGLEFVFEKEENKNEKESNQD